MDKILEFIKSSPAVVVSLITFFVILVSVLFSSGYFEYFGVPVPQDSFFHLKFLIDHLIRGDWSSLQKYSSVYFICFFSLIFVLISFLYIKAFCSLKYKTIDKKQNNIKKYSRLRLFGIKLTRVVNSSQASWAVYIKKIIITLAYLLLCMFAFEACRSIFGVFLLLSIFFAFLLLFTFKDFSRMNKLQLKEAPYVVFLFVPCLLIFLMFIKSSGRFSAENDVGEQLKENPIVCVKMLGSEKDGFLDCFRVLYSSAIEFYVIKEEGSRQVKVLSKGKYDFEIFSAY